MVEWDQEIPFLGKVRQPLRDPTDMTEEGWLKLLIRLTGAGEFTNTKRLLSNRQGGLQEDWRKVVRAILEKKENEMDPHKIEDMLANLHTESQHCLRDLPGCKPCSKKPSQPGWLRTR
jgi:hypothetical protein